LLLLLTDILAKETSQNINGMTIAASSAHGHNHGHIFNNPMK